MNFDALNSQIVSCKACPRLRGWCNQVAAEKRKAFASETYWGLPVPNFGDPAAGGLIVGLAPAAHGANRTGRMFTGDRSGEWLFRALYEAGLATQPQSAGRDDPLMLKKVMITAVCHCAPPDNKPAREEVEACRVHLMATLGLSRFDAFLCLGSLAWKETLRALNMPIGTPFTHGAEAEDPSGRVVLASYHPSQQNTFTGRLTREMLAEVVGRFRKAIDFGDPRPTA